MIDANRVIGGLTILVFGGCTIYLGAGFPGYCLSAVGIYFLLNSKK